MVNSVYKPNKAHNFHCINMQLKIFYLIFDFMYIFIYGYV